MNAVLLAAAKSNPISEVIKHLSPHTYSWSPEWGSFSITNAVLNIWLAAGAVILLFWIAASKPKIVPSGVQNLIEVGRDFIRDNLVYQAMPRPDDVRVWGPFIEALFFFILLMNAIGLLPGIGFTPTSNIFVTAGLAFTVYVVAIVIGMFRNGPFTFWKKSLAPEGVPKMILPLMILIELISHLFRPVSLSVRLFANMLADHLIILLFAGFIFLVGLSFAAVMDFLFLPAMIVFTAFALFVSFIQAVIFAFLSAFYINEALHPGH